MRDARLPDHVPPYPTTNGPIPEDAERVCDECGYSLTGLTENRCPECGTPFNPFAAPQARIPWLRRSKIGTLTAFVQTLLRATFASRSFAREICRPITTDLWSASDFKWISIWCSCAGSAIVLWAPTIAGVVLQIRNGNLLLLHDLLDTLDVLIIVAALALLLAMASEIPLVPFDVHGTVLRRLDVLQKYAVGPAVLAPVFVGVVRFLPDPAPLCAMAGFLLMMFRVRLWFLRVAARASALELIGAAFFLFIMWVMALFSATIFAALISGVIHVTAGQ